MVGDVDRLAWASWPVSKRTPHCTAWCAAPAFPKRTIFGAATPWTPSPSTIPTSGTVPDYHDLRDYLTRLRWTTGGVVEYVFWRWSILNFQLFLIDFFKVLQRYCKMVAPCALMWQTTWIIVEVPVIHYLFYNSSVVLWLFSLRYPRAHFPESISNLRQNGVVINCLARKIFTTFLKIFQVSRSLFTSAIWQGLVNTL